jgi:gluconate 2-dehydrogenase gamma chain
MSERDWWRRLSRREWLKRLGSVGAAAAVPAGFVLPGPADTRLDATQTAAGGALREPLETLTLAESETLDAIAARLIPTDANGPGAAEARATRYIDRALGGALVSFRDAYRSGLASVDRYSETTRNAPFAKLPPEDQDQILRNIETDVATGFATPSASTFFNFVLAHTIQGTFCDPYYGGNATFVGWDLLGYPGIRLAVSPEDQRLNARPAPTRRSAYDYPMFSGKKPARAGLPPTGHHAD